MEELAITSITIRGGKGMKPCNNCGNLPQHCTCNKKESKSTTAKCQLCGDIHHRRYLVNYDGMEICHDCNSIKHISPEQLNFFKQMAAEHDLPLVDMPTHLLAANRLNEPLGAYLLSLPRSREEFREYFRGKNITIGGERLKL